MTNYISSNIKMRETVTIAIPVYERTDFFRKALESALNQTIPVGIIVVDNASIKSDFKAIIAEYDTSRIHYHRNQLNMGGHGNFNLCIKLCPTPYVLILHDDDVLELDYIERLSREFDPHIDFYWCKVAVLDQHGHIVQEEAVDYNKFQKIEPWCSHNGAYQGVVMRCAKAVELGMFDLGVRYCPDWNLYMKFMLNARTRFLPFRGIGYRISELSASAWQSKEYKYHAYGRNQIKRNFSRAGLWPRYRELRFSRQIPSPNLGLIVRWVPELSRMRLAYYWAFYVRSESFSFRQQMTKWLLRLTGWRGIKLLATVQGWQGK